MKIRTSKAHFCRYAQIMEQIGILQCYQNSETFMGKTKEEMREVLERDPNLNNIRIQEWDHVAIFWRGKTHTIDYSGKDDGKERSASISDAVCALKHFARYEFVGARPLMNM